MEARDGSAQIVAIALVRNEDLFIRQVLSNVLDFCDRIIVADHCSTDGTPSIVSELASRSRKIELHRVDSPAASHRLIEPFAGTPTWVFGVDGDEIYDPAGLVRLRERLMAGEFDGWWQVFGNVLNCTEIDRRRRRARGYLAPPCRSMTKLFNFGAIDRWTGDCPERLHGGRIDFRPAFHAGLRLNLHEATPWDASDYRCLHTCFMPRSSKEQKNTTARTNIMEMRARNSGGALSRMFRLMRANGPDRTYKREKYMRGPLVEVDVSAFFKDLDV
jgi:glycosyltransferase involved in cell wall biosynthesis